MPVRRDVVVIGGSAGALGTLLDIVRALPSDFSASILIVQHLPPSSPSNLPEILSHAGALKAVHPQDGEAIRPGRIYIAPPDHHLLLDKARIAVKRGPKENRFRPSVDALFRSAAHSYGPRVIGVVLSGALDDGTSGLWTIKRLGGMAVVQDPNDATFPSMPSSALENVKVDCKVPSPEIGKLLVRLTREPPGRPRKMSVKDINRLKSEILIATRDNAFQMGIIEMGELTAYTCPECEGALTRLKEDRIVRFRCHTGHAYTLSSLLSEVSENVEEMLWRAMRGLEESNMLLAEAGAHFKSAGQPNEAKLFSTEAAVFKARARLIHDSVLSQKLVSGDAHNDGVPRANTKKRKPRQSSKTKISA